MKKLLIGTSITLTILLAFGTGVYAAKNWMNYTGDEAIGNTESNIDELLELLEKKGDNSDLEEHYETIIKDLQEQFQDQLEEVTASKDKEIQDLQKEIQDLQEQLADADDSEYVEHLEKELEKANEQSKAIEEYSDEALEKAKEE